MAINMELLRQARQTVSRLEKAGFVAAGDPAIGGAPPMDPAAAGGAFPMDPAAAGGAFPMDPAAAGGAPAGGVDPTAALMPMIQTAVQQAMASSGGGQSGPQAGGPGIKPKIDVNVEIMQIKKMLAKIVDAMGIHIPAQDMVATPEDLNQIAQGGAGFAAATPDGGTGGGLGQIAPIQPIKAAAEEWESGVVYEYPQVLQEAHTRTRNTANLAAALVMRNRISS